MAIKMVREPSETPNINNIDDIVPMRYAYGNQNGYVIGKGNEISNTVNGLNFTVNSGRLVLQGVECDIDASGVTITIDNIATKRYYVIYLQVNLGLNTAQILSSYDTATYPTIDAGDDLTENTTGIARLQLYRFIATSGVISNVNKVVESVKYIDESFIKNVKVNNARQADNASNAVNSTNAQKINDISIIKQNNTILVDNIIMPRLQLLWAGDELMEVNVYTHDIQLNPSVSLSAGDILFIKCKYTSTDHGDLYFNTFMTITKIQEPSSIAPFTPNACIPVMLNLSYGNRYTYVTFVKTTVNAQNIMRLYYLASSNWNDGNASGETDARNNGHMLAVYKVII